MKFGCLINLVLYAAMAWGYYAWWTPVVDPPHVGIIAVVASGFSYLGLMILYNAWLSTRDSRALVEAQNASPLQHGRWSAAAGTLSSRGKTLTSPWTGRDCVMLEYEISHDSPTDEKGENVAKIVDFLGLAMSECEIKTENGPVRLSGAPNLDAIPIRNCRELEHLQRAREFVRATDWLDCTGSNLIGQTGTDWTSLTDVEDSFRFDWRMTPLETCAWLDDESNETPPRLTEKCLAAGDQVVALGFYDEGFQALRSPIGQEASRIRLALGTAEQAAEQSRQSTRWRFIGGMLLLLLVNGGLLLGHWLYTRGL